jgi:hypothetical protein
MLKIEYNCEWPLEIVLDKLTIGKKYNSVFKLLLQVKYAKFIMEKRDYHIKKPNLLRFSTCYSFGHKYQEQMEELGARDRLLLENQLMLGRLL